MFVRTVVVLMFTCHAIRAQPSAAPITIDQAVSEAIDHNLNLRAERFNVDVADAAVRTASLRPNPVFTASLMRPDQSLVDEGISPHEQVFRTDYIVEGGGKRDRRMDQAALAKSTAALQLSNAIRTLRLDVESAFTDLQLAKANLALARSNLDAFNDVVRINTDRVRTGDLAAVELSRSRLAALQFQNDVRQRKRSCTSPSRLSALLVADRAATAGRGRRTSQRSQPIDYQQLLRQALEARPDMRALRTDQARSVATAAARQWEDRLHDQRRSTPAGRRRRSRQFMRPVPQRPAPDLQPQSG
jgi:cobalt-zinc-cadmium efflux system outer membrane protein